MFGNISFSIVGDPVVLMKIVVSDSPVAWLDGISVCLVGFFLSFPLLAGSP